MTLYTYKTPGIAIETIKNKNDDDLLPYLSIF
nr:MAG TPA: hypothetical protein [Siphoviridae sp. ct7JV2]